MLTNLAATSVKVVEKFIWADGLCQGLSSIKPLDTSNDVKVVIISSLFSSAENQLGKIRGRHQFVIFNPGFHHFYNFYLMVLRKGITFFILLYR